MENELTLFDLNRDKLKRIFLKLSKNEKRVNYIDFQRLCLSGKLIPAFVSQNQMRVIAGKFGNAATLTKLFLSFDQFEQFLKIISSAKAQPVLKADKAKLFFQALSQGLRTQFILGMETISSFNRSNSNISLSSNQDLNESNSSLDLSIKEALNTLKSDIKKNIDVPGRVSISPRPTIRAYSNSSTPKSKTYRGFNTDSANSKSRVSGLGALQAHKIVIRGKNKIGADLDEFLETEKMIQKEVMNVKVNLRGKEIKKPEVKSNLRYQFGIGIKGKTSKAPRVESRNQIKDKPNEKEVATLMDRLNKHKKFIIHSKKRDFSRRFVIAFVFNYWKSIAKHKKN